MCMVRGRIGWCCGFWDFKGILMKRHGLGGLPGGVEGGLCSITAKTCYLTWISWNRTLMLPPWIGCTVQCRQGHWRSGGSHSSNLYCYDISANIPRTNNFCSSGDRLGHPGEKPPFCSQLRRSAEDWSQTTGVRRTAATAGARSLLAWLELWPSSFAARTPFCCSTGALSWLAAGVGSPYML